MLVILLYQLRVSLASYTAFVKTCHFVRDET